MLVQKPSAVRQGPPGFVGLGLSIFFGMLVGFPSLLWAIGVCEQLLANGATWAEMDWDQNGHTSLSEVAASVNVGVRGVRIGAADCREFFRMKDGTTLRLRCPGSAVATHAAPLYR